MSKCIYNKEKENKGKLGLVFTLGADKTRPSTWVNWALIEIPEERSIGSAS
jgi:hypothetical protein